MNKSNPTIHIEETVCWLTELNNKKKKITYHEPVEFISKHASSILENLLI